MAFKCTKACAPAAVRSQGFEQTFALADLLNTEKYLNSYACACASVWEHRAHIYAHAADSCVRRPPQTTAAAVLRKAIMAV